MRNFTTALGLRNRFQPELFSVRSPQRTAFTLGEMLVSITILVMIAGTVGVLSVATQQASEHCRGQALAAQHARIALGRIETNVRTAWASESFPGCASFSTTVGTNSYPDTLVIWKPTSTAANPTGLPKVSELLVYTPDATSPNTLNEIRWASSTATAPALTSTASWTTLLTSFRTATGVVRTPVTDILRSAASGATPGSKADKGCLRFKVLLAPTDAQWTSYRAGATTWNALDWPLDSYGTSTGTRTVVCQTELQIKPPVGGVDSSTGEGILPFFGSASLSYDLTK